MFFICILVSALYHLNVYTNPFLRIKVYYYWGAPLLSDYKQTQLSWEQKYKVRVGLICMGPYARVYDDCHNILFQNLTYMYMYMYLSKG